jgi:hypothetical protein
MFIGIALNIESVKGLIYWLLASGVWSDTSQWNDTAAWNDGV